MMKKTKKIVYCSQCGIPLKLSRTAFRGHILTMVPPHNCQDVREPDFESLEIPPTEVQKDDEFVQKLDNLRPSPPPIADLRDRRSADIVKSTAPDGLLDSFKSIQHSTPATQMEGPEDEMP